MTKKKKKKINIKRFGINSKLLGFTLFVALLSALIGFYVFTVTLKKIVHSQETFIPADIIDEFHRETPHPTIPPHTDQIVFHANRTSHKIALTFDADMTAGMEEMLAAGRVKSYYDDKLIQILESTQTEATFFMTGMWIETYPKIAQQLAQNSLFELANHSYDHRGFDGTCYGLTPVPDDQDTQEVMKTQKLLEKFGVHNNYFRFPGGCYSQKDLDILTSLGMTAIQWDVAGVDGFNDNEASIEQNILNHTEDGSIIIMHMNGYPNEPKTADAAADIIATLKTRGFQFVTVAELLGQVPLSSHDSLYHNLITPLRNNASSPLSGLNSQELLSTQPL